MKSNKSKIKKEIRKEKKKKKKKGVDGWRKSNKKNPDRKCRSHSDMTGTHTTRTFYKLEKKDTRKRNKLNIQTTTATTTTKKAKKKMAGSESGGSGLDV